MNAEFEDLFLDWIKHLLLAVSKATQLIKTQIIRSY
jgi:hypothetical protein